MTSDANRKLPRIFFGHHKAATSWVIKILSDLAHLNGFRLETINTAAELDQPLINRLVSGRTQFLAFRNADPAYLPALGEFVGFHIIRDPRDILVSSYFSHLNSHPTDNWPELADHNRHLRALDQHEGLLADMAFCSDLITHGFPVRPFACMRDWDYSRKDIMEIRYEDLITSPYDHFLEIFRFLGVLREEEIGMRTLSSHVLRILGARIAPKKSKPPISLTPWNILSSVYDNRFTRKAAGRRPGEEDTKSHYRKGVSGDWKNHFDASHHERFNALFDNLPERLSYEPFREPYRATSLTSRT